MELTDKQWAVLHTLASLAAQGRSSCDDVIIVQKLESISGESLAIQAVTCVLGNLRKKGLVKARRAYPKAKYCYWTISKYGCEFLGISEEELWAKNIS